MSQGEQARIKPTKCGECRWFVKTDFGEEGSFPIGTCIFLPTSATRRFNDRPCGIWPLMLEILEEDKCKSRKNG